MAGVSRWNKKRLEAELSKVDGFTRPIISFEQYMTPPDLATEILLRIEKDVSGRTVADLGCGTGMLAIGCALLGADFVLGFEIDSEAVQIASENIANFHLHSKVDVVTCDINSVAMKALSKRFDVVIMNPPFGTKRGVKDIKIRHHRQRNKQKGTAKVVNMTTDDSQATDIDFLRVACAMATTCVYSLHKAKTLRYIEKTCKDWSVKLEIVEMICYKLTAQYKHEARESKDIEVYLLRLSDLKHVIDT